MLEDSALNSSLHSPQVFRTKQGAWHKWIQLIKGFHFPSTRTTNSVRLILGTQYFLCENYIKRARLHWGLKQVLGTNLIPLRTKFDTPTKRVPAWPVINQLWFSERHFSANGISLLLSSGPRGFAARSRVLARLVSLAQIGELARRLPISFPNGPSPIYIPTGISGSKDLVSMISCFGKCQSIKISGMGGSRFKDDL